MEMDSVSTLNQVMALLRQQARGHDRTPSGACPLSGEPSDPSSPFAHPGAKDVGSTLKEKLATLQASGVTDAHTLTRFAVETVLDQAFGQSLRNDPRFQAMVDVVHLALMDHENSRALFERLLAGLA
ncbi:hypothetical protein [Caballeronia sp. HLA56]